MKPRDLGGITAQLEDAAQQFERRTHAGPLEHLRSVQTQMNAICRGDVASLLNEAHADVQLDIFAPPEFKWIRHAKSLDELRHAVELNFDSVEHQRPKISNVIAQGSPSSAASTPIGTVTTTARPRTTSPLVNRTFTAPGDHSTPLTIAPR